MRASLVLTAASGGVVALLVLGAGVLPIRSFVWTGVLVLPLLLGAVMLAVGRWMRRIPLTGRPIDHPPLQRIERTANAVAAVSILLLVLGFVLTGTGLSGVVAFWVPAAVVAAAPAVGAAWWGLRRVSSDTTPR